MKPEPIAFVTLTSHTGAPVAMRLDLITMVEDRPRRPDRVIRADIAKVEEAAAVALELSEQERFERLLELDDLTEQVERLRHELEHGRGSIVHVERDIMRVREDSATVVGLMAAAYQRMAARS